MKGEYRNRRETFKCGGFGESSELQEVAAV